MTLRLDGETLAQLEELAETTDRSKAWLAAEAVRSYVAINSWQTRAIRDAVNRSNTRDARFFDNAEVNAWLASWGTGKERKPPR